VWQKVAEEKDRHDDQSNDSHHNAKRDSPIGRLADQSIADPPNVRRLREQPGFCLHKLRIGKRAGIPQLLKLPQFVG
jgi:hypothetical protein